MAGGRRTDTESEPAPREQWIENRHTGGWRGISLRELGEYRELLGFLALRDIRSRYKQTVLGVGWVVMQPLAATIVLVVVFQRFIDVPSDDIPYRMFALCGFVMWSYVSGTIGSVTGSLIGNPSLVTKVYFPRVVIPLSAVIPRLVDLGVGLGVLAVFMLAGGYAPPVAVLLLPAVVGLAIIVALGTGLWLSTLNVLYRDVGHGVSFLLQLWFFASPIAYPSSLVSDAWRPLYSLNPVVGLIDLARAVILGGPLQPGTFALSCGSAVVILVGGLLCFQRLERRFADVI